MRGRCSGCCTDRNRTNRQDKRHLAGPVASKPRCHTSTGRRRPRWSNNPGSGSGRRWPPGSRSSRSSLRLRWRPPHHPSGKGARSLPHCERCFRYRRRSSSFHRRSVGRREKRGPCCRSRYERYGFESNSGRYRSNARRHRCLRCRSAAWLRTRSCWLFRCSPDPESRGLRHEWKPWCWFRYRLRDSRRRRPR